MDFIQTVVTFFIGTSGLLAGIAASFYQPSIASYIKSRELRKSLYRELLVLCTVTRHFLKDANVRSWENGILFNATDNDWHIFGSSEAELENNKLKLKGDKKEKYIIRSEILDTALKNIKATLSPSVYDHLNQKEQVDQMKLFYQLSDVSTLDLAYKNLRYPLTYEEAPKLCERFACDIPETLNLYDTQKKDLKKNEEQFQYLMNFCFAEFGEFLGKLHNQKFLQKIIREMDFQWTSADDHSHQIDQNFLQNGFQILRPFLKYTNANQSWWEFWFPTLEMINITTYEGRVIEEGEKSSDRCWHDIIIELIKGRTNRLKWPESWFRRMQGFIVIRTGKKRFNSQINKTKNQGFIKFTGGDTFWYGERCSNVADKKDLVWIAFSRPSSRRVGAKLFGTNVLIDLPPNTCAVTVDTEIKA
jgi:hypothetical protein